MSNDKQTSFRKAGAPAPAIKSETHDIGVNAPGNAGQPGVQSTTTFAPPASALVIVNQVPAATTPAQQSEGTTAQPQSLVPHVPNAAAGRMLNDQDISFEHITIPAINVGQGVGDIGNTFGAGAVVFGRQFPLCQPPARPVPPGVKNPVLQEPQVPVRLVILGYQRLRYAEKLKAEQFGTGVQGRTYPDQTLVYSNGGTTNWDEAKAKNIPLFEPLASALVLVRAPDSLDPDGSGDLVNPDPSLFGYEEIDIETKRVVGYWGLAIWHQRGIAYTAVAKFVFGQRKLGFLKKGFARMVFELSTVQKDYPNGHSAYAPKLTPTVHQPPVTVTVADAETGETGGRVVALSELLYLALFGAVPGAALPV